MAARTDADAMQEIAEIDLVSTPSLTPFISAAHSLVESVIDSDDDDMLTIVETWLAVHFYHVKDMRPASESAGAVSQSFQYQLGLGLDVTMYGQQAKLLDATGSLARWDQQIKKGRRRRTGVTWVGTEIE